ncbi:aldehyde dehydrogenase family protein [Saccharopolyspora sp. MS10]|uniref:aldehyde dehydrogenase family protein n=1 Tax=Saccharopolyspora sp. MS10 TaxID=3385973 RepID=UPI0039A1D854
MRPDRGRPRTGGIRPARTRRRPVGLADLITPRNFPLAIPVWRAAPALVLGNAVPLKPAPRATACRSGSASCSPGPCRKTCSGWCPAAGRPGAPWSASAMSSRSPAPTTSGRRSSPGHPRAGLAGRGSRARTRRTCWPAPGGSTSDLRPKCLAGQPGCRRSENARSRPPRADPPVTTRGRGPSPALGHVIAPGTRAVPGAMRRRGAWSTGSECCRVSDPAHEAVLRFATGSARGRPDVPTARPVRCRSPATRPRHPPPLRDRPAPVPVDNPASIRRSSRRGPSRRPARAGPEDPARAAERDTGRTPRTRPGAHHRCSARGAHRLGFLRATHCL